MIRRLAVAVLLVAALLPSGPAAAKGLQPVPYAPLPTSYAELPLGPATTVPFWQAGYLHVGSTAIRTRMHEAVSRNGTTVVGRGWSAVRANAKMALVRGTELVPLPVKGLVRFGPKLSADGHWLTWLDEDVTRLAENRDRVRYKLVLYDTRTGKIVNRHRETRLTDHSDGINGLFMISVANTGQVLISIGDRGKRIFSPDHDLIRLKGRTHDLTQFHDGWPLGITVFRTRHSESTGLYGTVSPGGRFHAVGTTTAAYGVWSAAGDGFAFDVDGAFKSSHWVDRPAAGTIVQLGLPEDRDSLFIVGWDGSDSVLLWDYVDYGDEPISQLVRCNAATGACERVEGGPDLSAPAEFASS